MHIKKYTFCIGQFFLQHCLALYLQRLPFYWIKIFGRGYGYTVKLVYNDHPRDPEFLAVVDRWSLFRGNLML